VCNAVAFDRCLMLSTLVKMLKQNLEDQVLFLNHIIQCWPNGMENDITHLCSFIEFLKENNNILYNPSYNYY
jgi:hypothetical protein